MSLDSLFSKMTLNDTESSDVSLKKLFANPYDLDVEDNPEWICPKTGDRVEIVSYDTQSHVQECVRVAKMPYVTVKEIFPVLVGIGNGNYAWSYSITVAESKLEFMQWHYRLL